MTSNKFNTFNEYSNIDNKQINQAPSELIQESLFSFFKNLFTRAHFSREALALKQKGEAIVGSDALESSIDTKTLRFRNFKNFHGVSVRDIADSILGNKLVSSSKFLNSYLTLLFRELMLEEEYYKAQVALKQMRKDKMHNSPEFDDLQTRTEILADRIKGAREALNRAKKSNIDYIQSEFDKLVEELKQLAITNENNPKRVKELVAVKDVLENRLNLLKVAVTNLELDIRQGLIPEGSIEKDPLFRELAKFKEDFIVSNKAMKKSVSDLGTVENNTTQSVEGIPNNLNELKDLIDTTNKNINLIQGTIKQREANKHAGNQFNVKEKNKNQEQIGILQNKLKEQQVNLEEYTKAMSKFIKPIDVTKYVETINNQKQVIADLENQLKEKEELLKTTDNKEKVNSQIDKLESKISKETKEAHQNVVNFVLGTVKDAVNNPEVNAAKTIEESDVLVNAKLKLIEAGFSDVVVEDALKKIIDSKEPFASVEDLINLAINKI